MNLQNNCCTTLVSMTAAILVAISMSGCVSWPMDLPKDDHPMLVVKTARLPQSEPWITHCAEHSWFDVYDGESWTRIEVLSKKSGVRVRKVEPMIAYSNRRWGRDVHVVKLQTSSGDSEKIQAMIKNLIEIAPTYPWADSYQPFPGPNSNTFVDWCCRNVVGLRADLYSTAVGKDYATWLRFSPTSTGTGLELETMLFGAQVGLTEGVELHFFGLTAGVGFWPPRLKIPLIPDRIW